MDIQELINLYQSGKSLSFLATKYGTYSGKIKKILIENNVKLRTRAEQNKITNQARGKKVNHNYFDNIDTYQKAWLLGFIAADGSVAKDVNRIKISLSSVDREILEKIQAEIESERKIADSETNKGFHVSTLAWSSENQKQKIAKYGIVPAKTYKGMHLPRFNDDLQLAYMLGYYDGDGCFRNDGTTCRFEICSYDPAILQDFADLINRIFSIEKSVCQEKSRGDHYFTLTYSTKATVKILDRMYEIMNEANGFALQRKYQKYLDWKRQNNRI